MAYADYEFYQNSYFGTAIGPEDFPRLALLASAYLDAATRNRSKSAAGEAAEAVKNAACAIAETLQNEARMTSGAFSTDRTVTSETVGGWSRSFQSASPTGAELHLLDSQKREALQIYLAPHGLLQMGSRP